MDRLRALSVYPMLAALKERFWTNSENFAAMRKFPRQLWLLYAMHGLHSFRSFSVSLNLTTYLRRVFLIESDTEVTWYYAVWGMLLIVFGVPIGFLVEWIGLGWSIFVGSAILTVSHILFAFSSWLWLSLGCLYLGVSVGGNMFDSAIDIAVSYFTESEAIQTIIYGILYATMNIGAFLAFNSTDFALDLADGWNGYRLQFTIAAGASVLCSLLAYNYRAPPLLKTLTQDRPRLRFADLFVVFRERQFWQLFFMNLFLSGIRIMFRLVETVLVSYLLRTSPDVRYGAVLSINAILIIPLVAIASVLTNRGLSTYWWIVIGTAVSALSVLWLWLWPAGGSSTVAAIVALVHFTIGEAIWSSRTKQYMTLRAPQGRKAIYSGWLPLSATPGTLVAGSMGGLLLKHYCPARAETELLLLSASENIAYQDECRNMWSWVFLMLVSTPILLALFKYALTYEPRVHATVVTDEAGQTFHFSADEVELEKILAVGEQALAKGSDSSGEQAERMDKAIVNAG